MLKVENLKTYFHTREGAIKAVDGLSFNLKQGQTLGIVGESGSGKSVAVNSLLGLIPTPPGRIEAGTAMYRGEDLLQMNERKLREVRGKKIAMIFQDPMSSLNPYLRISRQLTEILVTRGEATEAQALERAIECMGYVGIPNPKERIRCYPHQFSGGMRQRVMIAMSLICEPDILIADEPTTALDVTIQAQILDLLVSLQKKLNMSVILITHDFGVIARMSDRVLVMYAGKKLEEGTVDDIFYRPRHPYTQGLLKSLPRIDDDYHDLPYIEGVPPDLARLGKGCVFAPRCEHRMTICTTDAKIPLRGKKGHQASCHWQG
ncbi:MAG: ABC transporter ATP-binding protein [Pseudomonadota bacterium]|nr:ABC transporter ATP-binding protein [Pseudomonadota bacterium]